MPFVQIRDRFCVEASASSDWKEKHLPDNYLGGICSNSGNEFTCVYQSGLDPQNIFCVGLIPGSSSSVPAGIITTFPLLDSQGNEEPQFLQKQVAK